VALAALLVILGTALLPRKCCKVRRFAYDSLLLRSTRPDQIADGYQSRCDAYTLLQ
jgi:hypothetical protein